MQAEFDLISTQDAEQILIKLCSPHYEQPGHLLAHQLKWLAASSLIPQITDHSGNLISDPIHNNTFLNVFIPLKI